MPDNAKPEDSLAPAVKNRSLIRGDVPDALSRRYYTDDRGMDGLGFYSDARIEMAAFRDQGHKLVAAKLDPNTVRDMAAIAQHRGWTMVTARGSAGFRREAWLAGRSIGLEVRGYRPTERDLQDLERRTDQRPAPDRVDLHRERRKTRSEPLIDGRQVGQERRSGSGTDDTLRTVHAVVQTRVKDPERQDRIMDAARKRIADWLDRGARFGATPVFERDRRSLPKPTRDR